MVRWVSATRMLVICLLDQANLCRSRAYDEHSNFENNGGLSRLEQAVELFSMGESVYNEPPRTGRIATHHTASTS